MDKAKLFVIWLDGFLEACGTELDSGDTLLIKNKLNDLFEHEAIEVVDKPTLEELGEKHGFNVTVENPLFGRDENGGLYRC